MGMAVRRPIAHNAVAADGSATQYSVQAHSTWWTLAYAVIPSDVEGSPRRSQGNAENPRTFAMRSPGRRCPVPCVEIPRLRCREKPGDGGPSPGSRSVFIHGGVPPHMSSRDDHSQGACSCQMTLNRLLRRTPTHARTDERWTLSVVHHPRPARDMSNGTARRYPPPQNAMQSATESPQKLPPPSSTLHVQQSPLQQPALPVR